MLGTSIGWLGMILLLVAYWLVSNKKLASTSSIYQLMNLFGALGVAVNAFCQKAWPALALELIWSGIAFVSLLNYEKEK